MPCPLHTTTPHGANVTPTISQTLSDAYATGLEPLDAQRLLLATLEFGDRGRAWLRVNGDMDLTQAELVRFTADCQRRLSGEPLAYITGKREFFGLTLQVDRRVLDPRPDTETLVDWALDVLMHTPHPHVVDLGTGSGAIALAIQHERSDAIVTAVDASTDALAVAQANADRLELPVRLIQGSWLTPLQQRFDLIVSNPPYIAEGDSHLPALVHEPIEALTSGPDGLDDIRLIVAQSPACLLPGGWLLLEHGHDQADAVAALLCRQGFVNVQSRKDLAGIARCTGGQCKPSPEEG